MTIDQAIQLALEHHNAGRLQQAEQIYRQVLQQVPNHPDALHLLGVLAQQTGHPGPAAELISQAIAVQPGNAFYHSNVAEALRQLGRLEEAEKNARRAIELSPTLAPAHVNLASTLSDMGRYAEAESEYRRALELEPDMPAALTGLGNVSFKRGDVRGAIELGRRAIAIDPNHPTAHNNLAAAMEKDEQLDEAERYYHRAMQLAPNHPEFTSNYGSLIYSKGNLPEAMRIWEQAVQSQRDHAGAIWNLSLGHLALGNLERGWELHEWRFKIAGGREYWRDYPVPRWDGFDLAGKRILLFPEQGFGDVIMFARYIPILAKMGARVLVHLPSNLVKLFKNMPGVEEVIDFDDPLPPFDTYQALLSVPWILKTTLQTIPTEVPYLFPDKEKVEQFRSRLSDVPGKLKVGLVWAGRPEHPNDRNRSVDPSLLAQLAQVEGVTLISLQKGRSTSDLPGLVDWTAELNDFADTAALIQSLDLVIAVDTSVAHLAGALGKPVWVLLPFMPDWRWMHDREDSPWYPTMRLFRQNKLKDWQSVIARVREELISLSR